MSIDWIMHLTNEEQICIFYQDIHQKPDPSLFEWDSIHKSIDDFKDNSEELLKVIFGITKISEIHRIDNKIYGKCEISTELLWQLKENGKFDPIEQTIIFEYPEITDELQPFVDILSPYVDLEIIEFYLKNDK